jgi:hypothetical protein
MDGGASPEPKCAVCGGPGRYVREPKTGDGLIWCAEHAPAATSPWVMIAQAILILAILGMAVTWLAR